MTLSNILDFYVNYYLRLFNDIVVLKSKKDVKWVMSALTRVVNYEGYRRKWS